jgi:hypothetical protein
MPIWRKMLLVAVPVVAMVGCDKPPTVEMDAARNSLEQARQKEAPEYADASFKTASDSLNAALALVATEEKAWFKNFDVARESLARAQRLSEKAGADAESSKAAFRAQAESLITSTTSGIEQARARLAEAPRGKGADEDLDRLTASLSSAESMIGQAREQVQGGRLKDAVATAQSAEGAVREVGTALDQAQAKIEEFKNRRRGRR